MNTFTKITQSESNYEMATEEILSVIDQFGFYTDRKFDSVDFKNKITEIIKKNVEGNVNYVSDI